MEDLKEIGAKIETELFVTQKERVDKLPSTRGTKMGKKPKSKSKTRKSAANGLNAGGSVGTGGDTFDDDGTTNGGQRSGSAMGKAPEEDLSPAAQVVKGMTYRKLRPEVKQTLEKIFYQLELLGKTLMMMEQRIVYSEDKLQEVMDFIKESDLVYVSSLVFYFRFLIIVTKSHYVIL